MDKEEKLIDALAPVIKDYFNREIKSRDKVIDELKQDIRKIRKRLAKSEL